MEQGAKVWVMDQTHIQIQNNQSKSGNNGLSSNLYCIFPNLVVRHKWRKNQGAHQHKMR
jgi:hypothetical protein